MIIEELILSPMFPIIIVCIGLWDAIWKGMALWRSSRNGHLTWFVFLLIVNSVGVLPIIYLLIHNPKKDDKQKKKTRSKDY